MKPGQTLLIGDTTGGEKMNGKIDDVSIYIRALTLAEIGSLYTKRCRIRRWIIFANSSAVTVASGPRWT